MQTSKKQSSSLRNDTDSNQKQHAGSSRKGSDTMDNSTGRNQSRSAGNGNMSNPGSGSKSR